MANLVLNLIDNDGLTNLCKKELGEIRQGMQGGTFREYRPELNPRFHRAFDVDLEGDFLEWFDSNAHVDFNAPIKGQNIELKQKSEYILLLAKWMTIMEWECWEARLFMYLEPTLGREIQSIDEFYQIEIWREFSKEVGKMVPSEYSESVILDWMARRRKLGETLEANEDPRILPTMESHKNSTETLHWLLEKWNYSAYDLLIGRDYLEAESWVLNGQRIGSVGDY